VSLPLVGISTGRGRPTSSWRRHRGSPSLGVDYHFGIDGISSSDPLTTLMGVIAIVCSFTAIEQRQKEYYVLLLLPRRS
jgi:NADH:ubiquinone oxidoreductase subunit 4 (subunit M)